MNWILQNLPTLVLTLIAIFFVGADYIKAKRTWQEEDNKRINKKIEKHDEEIATQRELESLHSKIDSLLEKLDTFNERMKLAEERLQDLTISDMHDIKSWIVDQYRKFYVEQGWIDAFSAETIDRRYQDYKKEGGNSYIGTLMNRLHGLPMDPPQEQQHKDKNTDKE